MDNREIVEEYLRGIMEDRKRRGKRAGLNPYLEYLEREGKSVLRVGVREAEGYQRYLTTEEREGGGQRYTSGSVQYFVMGARRLHDYLKGEKKVCENPFRKITMIRTKRALPKKILPEKEMDELLKRLREFMGEKTIYGRKAKYRTHVAAELMYGSGIRINEAASLREEDVDFERGVVRIRDTKGGVEREAIVSSYALSVLKIYVSEMRELVTYRGNGNDGLLFGKKMFEATVNAHLREEGITSHHFRHAMASHLLRSGCDIRYIQKMLGHRSIRSTEVYTKVEKDDLKRVIDEYHPRSHGRAAVLCDQARHRNTEVERAERKE